LARLIGLCPGQLPCWPASYSSPVNVTRKLAVKNDGKYKLILKDKCLLEIVIKQHTKIKPCMNEVFCFEALFPTKQHKLTQLKAIVNSITMKTITILSHKAQNPLTANDDQPTNQLIL
jgi:hypothetical protein